MGLWKLATESPISLHPRNRKLDGKGMNKGGWQRKAGGSWFPVCWRDTRFGRQEIKLSGMCPPHDPFILTLNGEIIASGDLDEVFELSEGYDV